MILIPCKFTMPISCHVKTLVTKVHHLLLSAVFFFRNNNKYWK